MLICCGFYPGDFDQAQRLAGWLREIGLFPGHTLLVARDVRCPENPFLDVGFDSVEEIVVVDDAWNNWPESANNVFQKCLVQVELVLKAPYWCWIEMDVVPMDQTAFDVLEAEYQEALAAGKLFLCDRVAVADVPVHGSGVGIYPGEMSRYAGNAKICKETAWDMAAREQIVPQMRVSRHIMHAWKRDANMEEHDPGFADWEAVEREIFAFKPQCKLFHASKKGSLINLLRERRNPPATSADVRFVQAPRAQILIKSYPVDYPLLKYCLLSVEKFAKGFWKPAILVVPDDHIPQEASVVFSENLIIKPVKEEEGSGYLFQQSVKANAHRLSDADYILHIDSDTVLTTEIVPEDFFREGKPLWFTTPYTDTHSPWKASTEKFIGHEVTLEFMRRLPMFIPRAVHEKAAAFCQEKHGINLHKYIMGSDHFSEFNALGAVAWDFFGDQIYWFNTSQYLESEWPPLVALQTWSHAPFAENQQKFEAILNGENLSGAEIERSVQTDPVPSVASLSDGQGEPAAPATHSAETLNISARSIIPWANQAETEAEIKRLCRELRKFQTAPRYIDRVRKELACFQVITGDKKIKALIKRRHRLGPKYDPMKPETLTKKQKSSIANIERGRLLRLELLKK